MLLRFPSSTWWRISVTEVVDDNAKGKRRSEGCRQLFTDMSWAGIVAVLAYPAWNAVVFPPNGDWWRMEILVCSNSLISSVPATNMLQVLEAKEMPCDCGIQEQRERERRRERRIVWDSRGVTTNGEEWYGGGCCFISLSSTSLCGCLYQQQRLCRADNLHLSIRFNPLNDLNVH